MLDPSVFKAYDVRGLYPSELDEDGAYRIGRAYVEHFEPRAIAVGRDMRLCAVDGEGRDRGRRGRRRRRRGHRPRRHGDGLPRGHRLELEGGICVTASHNPKDYTGMKIVRRGASRSAATPASRRCARRAAAGSAPSPPRRDPHRGRLARLRREVSFVDVDAIRPLRVVVDAANGMAA